MILLSFDIEEFDAPKEKGMDFTLEDGMEVSKVGTTNILDVLQKNSVQATLFCTWNFVKNAPEIIGRAIADGHEIACHGVDHWNPKDDDPKVSKRLIESATGQPAYGYRQPRMFPVSDQLIEECGYTYNSSLNPAFIPGKYVHLDVPRTAFMKGQVLQIPASVTPKARIPLFWLSLHNFPEGLYHKMARSVVKHDGYFMTYFHPWEFVNNTPEVKKHLLPIVNRNSGDKMVDRLNNLIVMFKSMNQEFWTMGHFTQAIVDVLNNSEDAQNPAQPDNSNTSATIADTDKRKG